MDWLLQRSWRVYVLLFVLAFAAYALVSGSRLGKQSSDPHFVLQADAWLSGRLDIPEPWKGDDPATVATVSLKEGGEVRGRYLRTPLPNPDAPPGPNGKRPLTKTFRTTDGRDIPAHHIVRTVKSERYVSFPPTPALLFLPGVALFGRGMNDVLPTVFFAALILPLCFATLRRLSAAGRSERGDVENLWLAVQLSFGTVLFFVAVAGRVWFTAHVVGVLWALAYCYFSIEARRPILAGLCLGLATLSRTPMAFMFPVFALEACRAVAGEEWRGWWEHRGDILKRWALFAAPVVAIAVLAAVHNYLRFDSPTEFGHSYLAVRQQPMIEKYGLFDFEYLRRNLSVALTLLPRIQGHAPYVQISGHGMALWITTPLLLTLLWPKVRGLSHTTLLLTLALIALPILCYQNSGWVQFGYRFSLDYSVFLILLLAVSGRPLGRLSKALIILSIAINLFGALTFGRSHKYYDYRTYDVVVPHHPA